MQENNNKLLTQCATDQEELSLSSSETVNTAHEQNGPADNLQENCNATLDLEEQEMSIEEQHLLMRILRLSDSYKSLSLDIERTYNAAKKQYENAASRSSPRPNL